MEQKRGQPPHLLWQWYVLYIHLHLSNSDIFGTSSHPWGHLSTWGGVTTFCFELHNVPSRWNAGLISAIGCLHGSTLLRHIPAPLASSPAAAPSGQAWLKAAPRAQGAHEAQMLPQLRAARSQLCPCQRARGRMPSQGQWRGVRPEIQEQRFSLNWNCQSYILVSEIIHAFPLPGPDWISTSGAHIYCCFGAPLPLTLKIHPGGHQGLRWRRWEGK